MEGMGPFVWWREYVYHVWRRGGTGILDGMRIGRRVFLGAAAGVRLFGAPRAIFDGRTAKGWVTYRGSGFPEGWAIEEGCIHALKAYMVPCLATVEVYEDFDFSFEWKITPGGNAGVFYSCRGKEPPVGTGAKPESWWHRTHSSRGQEYQILDDAGSEEGKDPTKSTAALYGKVAARADKPVRAAMEWNEGRIVVRGLRGEHWLNGVRVVEYEMKAEEKKASPIVLQHHHSEAWFRNLRIG
jgi:hypothetical protein